MSDWTNMLIQGDNLLVLKNLIQMKEEGKIRNADGSSGVRLIYIDPPFGIDRDKVFGMQKWNSNEEDYEFCDKLGLSIIRTVDRKKKSNFGIAGYLRFMYERLVLMRELLAENGSIYVHLDWHVGHYAKVIMDEIFGYKNFRNEIVWAYRTGGAPGKDPGFSKKHDVILFYSKSDKPKFNKFKERIYYEKAFFTPQKDESGRYYADVFLRDVLENEINLVVDNELLRINVKPVINVSSEKLDFHTQKPEELLQILIMATTEPRDIVADFFCGSGTTLAVAEKLGRRWMGVEQNDTDIIQKRLLNIATSKDLNDSKKKYGKVCNPFNLYKYETGIIILRKFKGGLNEGLFSLGR